MSIWWWIGWACAGFVAGLAILMPVALWVWQPPELLSLIWGAASVAAGWVAGAWLEERRSTP